MLLSKIKSYFSSKAAALFTMGSAAIGIISCDYGPVDCCLEYEPESQYLNELHDQNAYAQICHKSMGSSDEYDLDFECKYREVDRVVDAAVHCCAPLKPEDDDTPNTLKVSNSVSGNSTEDDTTVEINTRTTYVPTNAYAWCLLNTNPQTYACNLQKALDYEQAIKDCCSNSPHRDTCILSVDKNGGKCIHSEPACCDDLPDIDTQELISKANCEKILNKTQQCIRTREDACCRNVPESSSGQGLTKAICKQIFQETSGQSCVNDDDKYDAYNKK